MFSRPEARPASLGATPETAAIEYEKQVKDFFKNAAPSFDLILLGMGDNAHTASLFPHTDVLKEEKRLVKEVFIKELNMYRVTMTAPLINLARDVIFLVTGPGKAEALNHVLNNTYNPDEYPSQLIKPATGKLSWYIDEAAASMIQ